MQGENQPPNRYVSLPSPQDKRFDEVIGSKFEFNRFFRADGTEGQPSQKCQPAASSLVFKAKSHQRLLSTYMSPPTPYFGLLLFHGTGTGKTCTSIAIAERFASVFLKPPLVIFPSSLLRDNFETQTRDCGTPGLVQWEFRGSIEFANMYKRIEASSATPKAFDEALRQIFSNRVVIVDEAHNLRSDETEHKQVPPKIKHVLRVAQNIRLVLLTATPMYNSAREIVFLLNLLLANDKRPEISEDDVFTADDELKPKRGEAALRAACRGYVSFQSVSKESMAFPARLPVPNELALPTSRIPTHDIYGTPRPPRQRLPAKAAKQIACSEMKGIQLLAYKHVVCQVAAFMDVGDSVGSCSDLIADDDDDEQMACSRVAAKCARNRSATAKASGANATLVRSSNNAFTRLRMVSNVMFPSPGIEMDAEGASRAKYVTGDQGFNRCFQLRASDGRYAYRHGVPPFLDADRLSDHACKLDLVVRKIMESDGIVLVQSTFLNSGLLPLAFALEHRGYKRYGGKCMLHQSQKESPSKARASYVLWSGDAKLSPNNAKEIAVAKSPDNARGERIKVILASDVAKEGIDLKCVRQVHILDPWYHMNKLKQVVGRAIRHCSHAALPAEHRNVTVYYHAAIVPAKDANDARRESIDLRLYRIAFEKQARIDETTAVLESAAIETAINNHNKSGIADDRSTFRPEFAEAEVEAFASRIRACFVDATALTYEELRERVDPADEDIFVWALQSVLDDPSPAAVFSKKAMAHGRIVYISDKYMFQPQANPDRRLSLEERERRSFDSPAPLMRRIAMRLQKQLVNADQALSANDLGLKVSVLDVERDVEALLARVKCDPNVYRDAAIDYILDRMSCDEQLLLVPLTKPEALKRRLAVMPHVAATTSAMDAPSSFVNFEAKSAKDRYLQWRPSKRAYEFSPLDERRARANEARAAREVKNRDRMSRVEAFLPSDPQRRTFKMVISDRHLAFGRALQGTGCALTSTIKKAQLKRLVASLDKSLVFDADETAKKEIFCEAFELALRKHAPERLLRPYEHHLSSISM